MEDEREEKIATATKYCPALPMCGSCQCAFAVKAYTCFGPFPNAQESRIIQGGCSYKFRIGVNDTTQMIEPYPVMMDGWGVWVWPRSDVWRRAHASLFENKPRLMR